ncbi:GNAT family N-acetyltransferase [Kibdelosporangium persicum]|uniref:L-amino acid N-acyltransferase YncA n=1 Tax=Kibdelosporangium persicum TaxID=2698649 RepID=A0ABX2F428_9PSEU|nr:GNAT family N-acetyltransferase [Kibdelosporangium persicum]NRN65580.1 L-amino acid N-acyltransferase YncA [Kibdelosporangium persicum]
MRFTDGLAGTQSAWFTRLDPMLPAAVRPPEGDVVTAALFDGTRVAGVLVRTRLTPDAMPTLWSALEVWELHPMLGEHGMTELLTQWRTVMTRRTPGPDSSCLVTWPSRDIGAARAFLDHGMVPLSTLAIRTGAPVRSSPGPLEVRRASTRDLDTLLPLALAELEYSAMVGGTVLRPGAEQVKRAALARHLAQGDPIWIGERDGIAVAMAECWLNESAEGSWSETRVRHGLWGYINSFSVAPSFRGAGVGRELAAVVHRELAAAGAVGTFLYFNPPNPLSTVFWARQGYRPLWTIWEVRPASALR